MTILIKSAKIIDPSSLFHNQQKDILISNGVIERIENSIFCEDSYQLVKLENLHVSCGWFDTSTSFGDPGFEDSETIKNGLEVAAKSGFTNVAVNPNTFPVIDNKASVEYLLGQANSHTTNLYPIAALTRGSAGREIAELFDMQQSGAVAFGDYKKPIENDNLMKIALQYAQNFDGLILSFPKNISIANEGIANEGINSTKLGIKGIPALAEHVQISRDLSLLEYTGGKLHIPTISTAKSVELMREAKQKGLRVTCSVSAHHLTLLDDELSNFDSNFKVSPPLRIKKDIVALQNGVKSGVIDIITSDHDPINIEFKNIEFSKAKDGTIGLESVFGAVNSVLKIEDFIECITTKPKEIFGIENHTIGIKNKAEITLFNPELEYTFSKKHILSTSKNSAFFNKKLKGNVYGVFANNQLVLK